MFLILFSSALFAQQSIITSIGGNGITQYIGDGYPATNFSLANPVGVCVDRHKNVFIADNADARIRKIDKYDTLTTFAGTGSPGYAGDGGPASAAHIKNPASICLDTAGNIYVADQYNNVIRKINKTTGKISTVCGAAGGFGGDGGPATDANLNLPSGCCVDAAGNIYIADYGNHRIRKVTYATGNIATIAGTGISGYSGDNGAATNATLAYPTAICVDSSGNLYVTDNANNRVRKIATTGIITTVAGTGTLGFSGDNGAATAAKLSQPNSVYINRRGNLYISDFGNNRVRMVDAEHIIHTIAGSGAYGYSGDGGAALTATFNGITSVFADDSDYVYIADGANSAIRKVIPGTTGINDTKAPTFFQIFPNPSEGKFTIKTSDMQVNTIIHIYNNEGQLVYTTLFNGISLQIDLSYLPAGIYYLCTKGTGQTSTERLAIYR